MAGPANISEVNFAADLAKSGRSIADTGRMGGITTRRLLDAREPERLPQTIVDIAIELVGADVASLLLPTDDKQLYIAHSNALATSAAHATRIALDEGVIGRVCTAATPEIVGDDFQLAGFDARTVASSIVYPLGTAGALAGVLVIGRADPDRRFRPTDLERVNVLADDMLLALDNARRV
ncbi:MAG: hypothetical protein JWO36_6660, partial [Myxococcales bacterium]|nr:hypothetical protein [Myxococcales bacterium]